VVAPFLNWQSRRLNPLQGQPMVNPLVLRAVNGIFSTTHWIATRVVVDIGISVSVAVSVGVSVIIKVEMGAKLRGGIGVSERF
jgi:hypothetical protein